ncbi:MAG TPA: hypothetical protein ENI62_11265 [Gammaproteobacteria bacterium]|nr:hypothetical protein [Gammaproteobacteria bacterium]
MFCPLPVIRTQDAAAGMQTGDCLEVFCTDHGALNDYEHSSTKITP